MIRNLARRWADRKLTQHNVDLQITVANLGGVVERLTQERNTAQVTVKSMQRTYEAAKDAHASVIARHEGSARVYARQIGVLERQLADAASLVGPLEAEIRRLTHRNHVLEEQLRETNATIDGLGLANTELERQLDRKRFLAADHLHAQQADREND